MNSFNFSDLDTWVKENEAEKRAFEAFWNNFEYYRNEEQTEFIECFPEYDPSKLFQSRYGERLIIDIGWFPSFSIEGHFRTAVIQDFDWETPVFEKTCKDMDVLKNHLSEAIVVVSGLMEAGIK